MVQAQRQHRYRLEVLETLDRFGIRPLPTTDPSAAYDLLKSIYAFEVREMRQRRRELEQALGPQPLDGYRKELHRLQERYPILQLPAHHWVHSAEEHDG